MYFVEVKWKIVTEICEIQIYWTRESFNDVQWFLFMNNNCSTLQVRAGDFLQQAVILMTLKELVWFTSALK